MITRGKRSADIAVPTSSTPGVGYLGKRFVVGFTFATEPTLNHTATVSFSAAPLTTGTHVLRNKWAAFPPSSTTPSPVPRGDLARLALLDARPLPRTRGPRTLRRRISMRPCSRLVVSGQTSPGRGSSLYDASTHASSGLGWRARGRERHRLERGEQRGRERRQRKVDPSQVETTVTADETSPPVFLRRCRASMEARYVHTEPPGTRRAGIPEGSSA